MTTKTKAVKRQPWEVDFVNCELNREAKETLKGWDPKGVATADILNRAVSDGFKLTVTFDKRHDCFIGSLVSPKDGGLERQQCLVARGPDFGGALRSVAYKHGVILDGQWVNHDIDYNPDDQWG